MEFTGNGKFNFFFIRRFARLKESNFLKTDQYVAIFLKQHFQLHIYTVTMLYRIINTYYGYHFSYFNTDSHNSLYINTNLV